MIAFFVKYQDFVHVIQVVLDKQTSELANRKAEQDVAPKKGSSTSQNLSSSLLEQVIPPHHDPKTHKWIF
jgi:hypothetical protein